MNRLRDLILSNFVISPSELNRIIATAPHRYKVFYIPKKKSGSLREIAQPAKELKAIQNWLVSHLSNHLPIHDCAVAYRKERGIKHNALRHSQNRFVLKMDLKDFFPSIVKNDIELHLLKYGANQFSETEIADICKIVLWSHPNRPGRHVCIGAPSSPFISNSILFDLDNVLDEFSSGHGVVYTRYADDLVFSTNHENVLNFIEQFVYEAISTADYPRLTVNKSKTIHTSRGRGINVTGVIITPTGALSVGRDRKRLISASIHRFLTRGLPIDEVQKLNGLLAFVQDIEPAFIVHLKKKYGPDVLHKIRNHLSQR